MMKQKINIGNILKSYPKETELYSPICGKCYLENVNPNYIEVVTPTGKGFSFNYDGTYCVLGEIMLFPSKENKNWSKITQKICDGDVVVAEDEDSTQMFIVQNCICPNEAKCYIGYEFETNTIYNAGNWSFDRIATEEEKQKLFDAIKANGYRWNEKTKTLEKLTVSSTPEKFYIRIGDIPNEEKSSIYRGDVVVGYEDGVSVYNCVETDGLYRIVMPFPLKEGQGMTYECLIQEITQCRYEIENPRNVYLVSGIEVGKGHDNEPLIKDVKILKDLTEQFNTKNDNTEENKTLDELIDPMPMFKVGDEIVKRNSISNSWIVSSVSSEYYGLKSPNGIEGIGVLPVSEQDDYDLLINTDKFYINTLIPFESRVLVRDNKLQKWSPAMWGYYDFDSQDYPYKLVGGCARYCIPYEKNEHLLGTTNDCDNFFKTW